jgi:predicted RNA-binding Zn-ribbon protein involved in translation (DUF1610 family)
MSTLVQCPKCKAEIEDDSFFCDQCGEELLICQDCNVFGKGKRCTRCGKPLVSVRSLTKPSPTVGKVISTGKTIRPQVPPKATPTRLVSTDPPLRLALEADVVIGRRSGGFAEVFSSQSFMSGKHASLQKNKDGNWEVTDLDSTNGTFLNGDRLKANVPVQFQVGDFIRFANVEFKVE